MSFTIHSAPRRHLPRSHTRLVMRAMSGVQDAVDFQGARDALLRYYYSVLRILNGTSMQDPQAFEKREEWATALIHSKDSTELFLRNACLHPEKVSRPTAQALRECIACARKDTDATPYARVGRVLSWLKTTRLQDSGLAWSHGALRAWMQGMLHDFTLADARRTPGCLLRDPEVHYGHMVASWARENTGVPMSDVFCLRNQPWYGTEETTGLVPETAARAAMHLRSKLLQEGPAALALMADSHLGVTRHMRPTWRDVTDFGVLHPLLTLDEASFDKSVWLDVLRYQGNRWSNSVNEATWHAWQEKAQTSYQSILQVYAGSTPRAFVGPGNASASSSLDRANPLALQPESVLPLDWYKALSELSERFPYLNQSVEIMTLATMKLSAQEFAQFQEQSRNRVGQPLVQTFLDFPASLEGLDTLNLPGWFHAALHSSMRVHNALELPDNILDDTQEPPMR